MTLEELCNASLRFSDNTADNLLLKQIGGPSGFGKSLRGIGDEITTPERFEPELSLVNLKEREIQDTSTPRALATSFQAFTMGNTLPKEKQNQLIDWLKGNKTGRSCR
ncbi:hypothetical protein BK708_25065 [Bacillus thuringiensis serovar yunnanensis]|nr:hypothetical protein BK708_25065 [Bacillus thuringiensis serovar yunnanensis]